MNEKVLRVEILGLFSGVCDLENNQGKLNFQKNQNGVSSISFLGKPENKSIVEKDIINVKIMRCHIKMNKTPVFECELDLNNLNIISK